MTALPDMLRKDDLSGLFPALVHADMIGTMQPALEKLKYYIDPRTRLLTRWTHIATETDWLHIRQEPEQFCNIYWVIARSFGFIPSRCLNCWKVVISPRSVADLVRLVPRFMAEGWHGKMGTESRPWVPRNYGIYLYNDSYEAGEERFHGAKALVDEIAPDAPIILKRFCTEFEIKLCAGDSSKYPHPGRAEEYEKRILELFDLENEREGKSGQPEAVQLHVIRNWIEFASARGDPTVKALNNNEELYGKPRAYLSNRQEPTTQEVTHGEEIKI